MVWMKGDVEDGNMILPTPHSNGQNPPLCMLSMKELPLDKIRTEYTLSSQIRLSLLS